MHMFFLHTLDPDTFFSVSGVFWSLAVEIHFYVLFPLLVVAGRRFRLACTALALVYACAATWYFGGRGDGTVSDSSGM